MYKHICFAVLFCAHISIKAQNTYTAIITDSQNNEPLIGASVSVINKNLIAKTDVNGLIKINNIPNGVHYIKYTYIGFIEKVDTILFPNNETIRAVLLVPKPNTEMPEVVVTATRTSRNIKNNPTRVELIEQEELDEKSNMQNRPGISMVLHESTGLQVQQTSATTGNASIRVQGLDGRYTQLLKDGFANFGNFASGLSLLEIPPLDVKQVEVIKGPASTLYGGGAIAGVVNFVSKTPKEKQDFSFLLNQSHIAQTNVGIYAAKKIKKFGYAILANYSKQSIYDVDKDDFTEVPKGSSFNISPRLFYYPNSTTTIMLGNSFTTSNLQGGDIVALKNGVSASRQYIEANTTQRNTTTLQIDKKVNNKVSLQLKQGLSYFNRAIKIPNYNFGGLNTNAFTDFSFITKEKRHTIIAGINFIYDYFNQKNSDSLNMNTNTTGVYVQHTYDMSDKLKFETGLRLDNVSYFGKSVNSNQSFLLPRFSLLYTINEKWTSRIGVGKGYKTPTIFTEQTETNQYQNILPLQNVIAEQSTGTTADFNFRSSISEKIRFTANQLFFYTQINKPLVLQPNGSFVNKRNPVKSYGFETNLRFIYREDLKLFVGYTYNIAKAKYLTGNQSLTLFPQNKLNLILIYEKEDNFKLGLEGYFTDKQYLYNYTKTPSFWELGFMAEKTIKENFSFFVNFENFTNVKQSKYKRVVNLPIATPSFDEIWTHTEGFVFNAGVKIKL